ncbi:MAG: VWA domain-containing protein [Erysipelotrichaceae bacterium]|nr:VWA domain-containing protein [Erysipelotrichaceae bacterium]
MNETSDLVFILDRSGSMGGLEKSTIKGFNKMIKKQKKLDGDAFVTTILFDDKIDVLYQNKSLEKVKKLTEEEYYVRGCTALLDTVGFAITKMKEKQKKNKTDHVIFVITTDGYENASHEFTYQQINKLIKKQQKQGWEFIFLGARINAQKEASKLGIKIDHTVNLYEDAQGVDMSYKAMDTFVENARNGHFDPLWSKEVNDDYITRKTNED